MRYIIFIIIGFLLYNCRGSESKPRINYLKVVEILDGHTLKTSDNKVIRLVGVSKTQEGQKYLIRNVLDKKVSYKFDKKHRSVKRPLKFYLTTQSGISVNAEMLKRKVSALDKTYLVDSLRVFTAYADGNEVVTVEPSDPSTATKPPSTKLPPPVDNRPQKDFKQVVKETEKGVFLVYTFNGSGSQMGLGTGFFINDNGLAVSNHHVFEGGRSWQIKLLSGEEYLVGDILYESKANDFVIFHVDVGDTDIRPIPLYNKKIEKGEEVFVLGNPEGLESTLSRGVVSALRKDFNDMDLVQIDAAISPGSSGSPVMTMSGEALGIATLKLNDCENCNFAVNIDLVKKALRNID